MNALLFGVWVFLFVIGHMFLFPKTNAQECVLSNTYTWNSTLLHTYAVLECNNTSITWFQAQNLANNFTIHDKIFHLVTITTSEENSFIIDMLDDLGYSKNSSDLFHFWIAGSDSEEEETWKWIAPGAFEDGEIFWIGNGSGVCHQIFCGWASDQPKNYRGFCPKGENYIEIWNFQEEFEWNDACSNKTVIRDDGFKAILEIEKDISFSSASGDTTIATIDNPQLQFLIQFDGGSPNFEMFARDHCGEVVDGVSVFVQYSSLVEQKFISGDVVRVIQLNTNNRNYIQTTIPQDSELFGETITNDGNGLTFSLYLGDNTTIYFDIITSPVAQNIQYGTTSLSIDSSTNKWSVRIEEWPFSDFTENTLELSFSISNSLNTPWALKEGYPRFDPVQLIDEYILQTLLPDNQLAQFSISFSRIAIIDNSQIVNVSVEFEDNYQSVKITFPAFQNSLLYDPNFGILVGQTTPGNSNGIEECEEEEGDGGSNNTAIIVASVVVVVVLGCCVFIIIVITLVVVLYKKYRTIDA